MQNAMAKGLMAFLDPEAIELQSEAATDEEIIRILAGKLERLGRVTPGYVDAVLQRERTLPTGLPLGGEENAAIPHTDPEHVLKAGVALATMKAPVIFGNMEDPEEKLPVRFVFLLAIDDKKQQIETLRRIMATIQDAEALEGLRQARVPGDVAAVLE